MLRIKKKSQSTLEYALLIGLVVGALLGTQNYLKRGLQGKYQVIGDQFGDQYSPGFTYRSEHMDVTNNNILETTTPGFTGKTTTLVTGGTQSQNSERKVRSLDEETWVE